MQRLAHVLGSHIKQPAEAQRILREAFAQGELRDG